MASSVTSPLNGVVAQLESPLARHSGSHLGYSRGATLRIPATCSKKSSRMVVTRAATGPNEPRKYTGYVEKDTAGQTNIYAVEPDLYVSKSAISTNAQGTSEEGSGGTIVISALLAVAALSGASIVLLTVNNSQPAAVSSEVYSGPPLDFYVQKFQAKLAPVEAVVVEASVSAPEIAEPASPAVTEEVAVEVVEVLEVAVPASVEASVSAPEIVEPASPAVAEEAAVVEEAAPVSTEDSTPAVEELSS